MDGPVEDADADDGQAQEEVEAGVHQGVVQRRAGPAGEDVEVEQREGDDDVLEEAVQEHLGHAAVAPPAVNEQQRQQEPELRDGEV